VKYVNYYHGLIITDFADLARSDFRISKLVTGEWRLVTGDWRLATGDW
jgi:hypothetical protein